MLLLRYQVDNGIPVIPFYDCKDDIELMHLYNFLLQDVLPAADVRDVLKKHFQLNQMLHFPNCLAAAESLF